VPTFRLLRTSGFQIAILYLSLFSFTLIALLAVVYWSTTGLVERQMQETIEAEVRGLAEQYNDEGLARLVEVIAQRSGRGGDPASVFILTDPTFRHLAGNLESWPEATVREGGWLDIRLTRTQETDAEPHLIRALAFDLPGDFHLLVGRDTEGRGDLRRIIGRAFAWAVVPALLLGLLGGTLIGRYTLRRVDAVRATGQTIMAGDLSQRVALTGSGDEFDRLAQTINDMLDRIEALMTGMRAVTDSLAHDLRSPLTRAKSGIEFALRKGQNADSYRQALEQTGVELDGILRTFESLINIAQAEAGLDRLSLTNLDLSALVTDLFEVYQPIAEEAGLELDGDILPAVSVSGQRQLLGQAIANLLDNAIKYTPAGGRVSIRLDRDTDAPVLIVSDSGPGIPEPERERVLQRFVRLDDSRGTPGAGLGLSLVAAVAHLHGAALQLDDAKPGLQVTLTFPAAAENTSADSGS